ncbi:DinB family protein [Lutibacter flavus]|uniref:DinB superfamily protein n=1 Tax=Lutibacter flavus TaxID=691689 RepID=A0A238YM20_9FLAO|nr:DinB family protein [Lutibacter flavus]SNR71663.1 DinB superfamily protein [Lutibacter flavus]
MNSSQLTKSEYPPFYSGYIKALGAVNLIEVLSKSLDDVMQTLKDLPEEKLLFRYEIGKWTIKELVQHIVDAERVLSYRALCFARNDLTNLPGFNEDWYVENSNANNRNFHELLEEFTYLRESNITLFSSFTTEMLATTGSLNEQDMSVRALGFIIAGHQIHHLKIIKEKYL